MAGQDWILLYGCGSGGDRAGRPRREETEPPKARNNVPPPRRAVPSLLAPPPSARFFLFLRPPGEERLDSGPERKRTDVGVVVGEGEDRLPEIWDRDGRKDSVQSDPTDSRGGTENEHLCV